MPDERASPASKLDHCRIVLVRTHYAGNLGSVARVMRNYGLRDLVLVDPIADVRSHEARMLSTHGVEILDTARIVPDLKSAVIDCHFVLASSGETAGTLRETLVGTPRDWFPKVAEVLSTAHVALVFGPEPHGLANEEIAQAHGLLFIPTCPEYTSLNLSMSVGISLYELYCLVQTEETTVTARPPAAYADFDRAMQHLHHAMRDLRFLFGQNADALMNAFRHLVGRALPTEQEVKLLHGLARQLEYAADQMKKAETHLRSAK